MNLGNRYFEPIHVQGLKIRKAGAVRSVELLERPPAGDVGPTDRTGIPFPETPDA
jgi:hypothetical protein